MSLFKRLPLNIFVIVILAVTFGGTETELDKLNGLVNAQNAFFILHRLENRTLQMQERNEKLNDLADKVGSVATKINALEGKLNELDITVSTNMSTLLHHDENVTLQIKETNVKLNDLADKVGSVATKMNALEGKLNELDITVSTNMSTLLHHDENVTLQIKETNVILNALESKFNDLATTVSSNVSKYAENVKVHMNESNVRVNNLMSKMDLLATDVSKLNTLEDKLNALQINETNVKLNDLEGKLNALTATVTNLVGPITELLLKPLSSCVDAFARPFLNRGSGVYNIQSNANSSPFDVYCLADPKGGLPWTVVQRRVDGSVDFYRNWKEYQRGFGDLDGNFFFGLDKMHSLTTNGVTQELWVMLTDPDGISANAYYSAFAIGSEEEKYSLKVLGQYSGDAGDSLTYHKSMKFTTYDNDNGAMNELLANCAESFKSAWWFNACHLCQLNGVYGSNQDYGGLNWRGFRGSSVSMKYAHMAIRPARK